MRLLLYNSIIFFLLPIMIARLIFKSLQDIDYIKNFSNRIGFYSESPEESLVWFHAVSLGEVISSQIIVKKLLKDSKIVLTVSTPTGLREAKKIYGQRLFVVYAPWDLNLFVKNFLKKFKPKCLILLLTSSSARSLTPTKRTSPALNVSLVSLVLYLDPFLHKPSRFISSKASFKKKSYFLPISLEPGVIITSISSKSSSSSRVL